MANDQGAGPAKRDWATPLPEGCPPDTAVATNGVLWRRSLDESDWQTAAQNNRFLGDPECERRSLSCFSEEKALRQTLKIKEAWDNGVVYAVLRPEHGVCSLPNKRKHVSLWLTRAAFDSRSTLFKRKR